MEGKPKVGKAYLFDSAPQEAFVAWQRPVTLKGRRMLIKAKDTLMDKLHGRSWYYSPDDCFLFYVVRGGYVEERCLHELDKQEGRVMIWCYCESCKNHDDDDTCKLNSITVSDREMTAAGFLPQCQEYEEEKGE